MEPAAWTGGSGESPAGEDLAGDLPDELRARIKAELDPGERLLWAARANPRRLAGAPATHFVVAAGFLVVSGVCWAGFAGAFGARVQQQLDAGFAIIGLIAGLVGFFVVLGTVASWLSGRSVRRGAAAKLYALTERRAIVWSPMPNSRAVQVHTFPRGTVKSVHRVEYPDGSGNVNFGFSEESYWSPVGFEAIPDVRRVENLVRRTLIDPEPPVG